MTARISCLPLLVGLLLGLTPVPAAATLVVPVGLAQMTREAEIIVHARVLEQQVTWSKDHARILTLTRLQVIERIKGTIKAEPLTIYQVGGTLDGVTINIPGALHFIPGEEMIFFAMRFDNLVVSYGMGLGKYRIFERDGVPSVEAQFGDVGFVRRAPNGQWLPSQPTEVGPFTLSDFVARLHGLLAGGTP